MSDARTQAVLMLQEILEQRLFLSEAKNRLDSQAEVDNAFINMLLLTALRRLVYLRRILKKFVKKKLPRQAAFAEYALLLGATEILYLNTPDYAVINSYVNLVKIRLDKYVAGFINAVLRKICASREELLGLDNQEFFTSEFFKILKPGYGPKTIRKIEQAALAEPSLDLTVKTNPAETAARLGGVLLPLETVRLDNNGRIDRLPGYTEGDWWVQDFASSLPVKMLGSVSGKRVLDLCAAPGGKTAQLINGGALVTALDISESRLETLHENLNRLNLKPAEVVCSDARYYLENFTGEPFDIILLDAPCSATGTIRRHPELVHIKTLADVEKSVLIQKQLLNVVSKALKPGGLLLYAVCSLASAEGELQIRDFLSENTDFRLSSLDNMLPPQLADICAPAGFIRVLPQHLPSLGGADGFFIALLQKAAD